MKYINTILAILLVLVDWYRYHLPVYYNNISTFDLLTLVGYGILCIIILIKPKNLIVKGAILFTLIGVADSIIDELFLNPTNISQSDNIIFVTNIVVTLLFIAHRKLVKKESLL